MVDNEPANEVDLKDWPTALEVRTYRHDEEIILEGEENDHFFVVLNGEVKISRRGRRLGILGEGDVFGLESSVLNHPSSVSARPIDNARIAMYGKEAIDFILYERPQMSKKVFRSLLDQQIQMSRAAVREEGELTLDDVNIRFYGDGEVVIREGDRETNIFKLISSERGLAVTKNGREVGRILRPGDFFGEMASVLNQERSATVTSKGNSAVQVYSAEHIQDMIEEHPEIARKMISTLAQRLSYSIKKISRLQKELETKQQAES